jgi:Ser/Thr protein kinase RdoA (MazF antagonist)
MGLDEKILEVLYKLYDIDRESIKEVNECGEIFECSYQENYYVLRLSDYKSFGEQKEEADFINYLYQNGVNVANVIPSKNGEMIEIIEYNEQEIYAALFSKALGHQATSKEWDNNLIEKYGKMIGKMHKLSKQYSPQNISHSIKNWFEQEEYDYKKHLPECHELIMDKCDALFNAIKSLPRNKETYGLIHSDIGQGNSFIDGDEITIFDFQDCEYHYFMNDIAIMIYFGVEQSFNGKDINTYSIDFINSLLKGYRSEIEIDSFWIEKIPLFLKLREMLSFIIFYCYWDIESLNEDQKALLNLYRKNIEYDIPVLNIDFSIFNVNV